MSEARERLEGAVNDAVFNTTGEHMDDPPGGWVCLAVAVAATDAVLAHPDDLIALLVETFGVDRIQDDLNSFDAFTRRRAPAVEEAEPGPEPDALAAARKGLKMMLGWERKARDEATALLHRCDGQLGLGIHREAGVSDEWKAEAEALVRVVRIFISNHPAPNETSGQ